MKVFLDANILFSASDRRGATRALLDWLARGGEAVTSPHAWEEARRNLAAKRPHLLPGLLDLETRVATTHAFRPPCDSRMLVKDKPILAGAIGAGCTHLWTSDRTHFGALYGKNVAGVRIVSSVMLAEAIRA
jgi:predicted nucleic acid-binding protein